MEEALAVQLLEKLVQIKSFSSEEGELASFITNWCSENGIQSECVERNVLVFIKGTAPLDSQAGKRAVIFNGHMDTVGPGEIGEWRYPPYGEKSGVVEEGRLYGLGSSDMKAALAAYLVLLARYKTEPPPIDVFFAFVTEEETSGDGTRNYLRYFNEHYRENYSDLGVVIGEPTDLHYAEVGNRGALFFEVEIKGESCHAAQAAGRKTNAPELLLSFIGDVQALEEKWRAAYSDPLLGQPAITITSLSTTESSPNQVPSSARVRFDVRSTLELHDRVEAELKRLVEKYGGELYLVTAPNPAALAPEDARIVESVKRALPGIELRAAKGANDTSLFNQSGIPALTFGPGTKSVIHCVDESAEVDNVMKIPDLYHRIVQEFAK